MIRQIILTAGLCLGLTAGARTLGFSVNIPEAADNDKMQVAVSPADNPSPQASVVFSKENGSEFKGQVTENPGGIYNLYVYTDKVQMSLPVYVKDVKDAAFGVTVTDNILKTSLTDDANRALFAYNTALIDRSRSLMRNENELTDAGLRDALKGYITDADSILAIYKVSPEVKDYIGVWSYISAYSAYDTAVFMAKRAGKAISFSLQDCLPDPSEVLDNSVATWFPQTGYIVASSITGKTIEDRMAHLYERYKQPVIRAKASSSLISTFLDRFNYRDNFAEGEAQLEALTAKYDLPDTYLATFRARHAVMPGAVFPDVVLVDKEGNQVEFSKFRGKYVYIDLWASWCGPCIREVPSLKAIEKELAGGNVEFVSISLDTDRDAWLNKMKQLDMHGNQLLDRDGRLGQQLNIRGIPHFLIYDPEGRMYQYNAPRPSAEGTLQLLKDLK